MRLIKYRAWDKKGKKMLKVDMIMFSDITIEQDGYRRTEPITSYVGLSKGIYVEGVEYRFDEVILIQYIGRKDKNGKEIYEGDIDENRYVVEWHNRTSEYLLRHKDGSWSKVNLTTNIIGNKFENPELLGKESK